MGLFGIKKKVKERPVFEVKDTAHNDNVAIFQTKREADLYAQERRNKGNQNLMVQERKIQEDIESP